MPTVKFTVSSILGGNAPAKHFSGEGQYDSAVAIDPDYPVGSEIKTSGLPVPTRYEKFSGSNIDAYPLWFLNSPKDTKTYVYQSNGKFVSYDSSFASESLIGTPTNGAGQGAVYHNNYIYLATTTDVARYGPLNGSPSLTNGVWTGSTLGTQTALTNTTYPTLRGVSIPNHAMHVHSNNTVYLCDFKNGQGFIHSIKTTKVTVEGDTNDGSAYNSLDLPFGFYPTDIESYGTDLVISAIKVVDNNIVQGSAALFFWDTISDSFYRQVPVKDTLVTSMLNINGSLFVFHGNAQRGFTVSQYAGGDSLQQVVFFEEGFPPLAGAVDAIGTKIVMGSWISYPETAGCVLSVGSKNLQLPQGLHNIVKSTSAGANPMVTALKQIQQDSSVTPKLIVGWGDDSAKGIDKYSTTATYASRIRFPWINIGQEFSISKIVIPLAATVAENMSVTPKIYVDDNASTAAETLQAINDTNYDGKKTITYKTPEIETRGEHNMMLELNFAGTVQLPINFPITIYVDITETE